MQPFSGSLANYRLQLVVPALCEGKPKSGWLRVVRGGVERHFQISRGTLVHARSNEPREHLAQVLADLNILDAARAAAAFETAAGASIPFGSFLVDRGFVDRGRMCEALAHKAREAFFDCYRWEAGEVSFVAAEGQATGGIALELPLGALHRDALARDREWRVFHEVFPDPDATFQVFREWAAVWGTEPEEDLLDLAESGATLAQLLAAAREGPLFVARRILQLYRRGVMTPLPVSNRRLGETVGLSGLLGMARDLISRGEFEGALALAVEALERAPVPEAQALYRDAELRLVRTIAHAVAALEGRLEFAALPSAAPPGLTADDLLFHSRLRSKDPIGQIVKAWPTGELAAFRCLQRLLAVGMLTVLPATDEAKRRRQTDPFGLRL